MSLKLKRGLRVLFVLGLLALLASCGAARRLPGAALDAAEPPGSLLSLPAPSALQPGRAVSAATLSRDGADFEGGIASQGVSIEDGTALFSATGLNSPGSLAETAFAVYSFNLEGVSERTLRVQHTGRLFGLDYEPWIGIANFERDRWDWARSSFGRIDVGGRVRSDGAVYVAVMHLGVPPVLRLRKLGFELFDEAEDNDSFAEAAGLPELPFAGFSGSIGDDGQSAVNDGDLEDWFMLPADLELGTYLDAQIQSSSFGFSNDLNLELCDKDGNLLQSGISGGTFAAVFHLIGQGYDQSVMPLKLRVSVDEADSGCPYELRVASGRRPQAQLSVEPKLGDPPGLVLCDASASTDEDGDILYYEWYLNGASEPSRFTLQPQTQFSFDSTGSYSVEVVVLDAMGFSGLAEQPLFFGPNPYDEIENNDFSSQAQLLDPAKAGGFKGSIGRPDPEDEPDYAPYDGDSRDVFKISIPAGHSLRAEVELESGVGIPDLDVTGFDLGLSFGEGIFFDPSPQLTNDSAGEGFMEIEVSEGFDDCWGNYVLRWYSGISPQQPQISLEFGPGEGVVNFSGSGTDSDGEIARYVWDFQGDGTADAEGAEVSHVYSGTELESTNIVHLLVYDDDGLRSSAFAYVEFMN